MTYDVGDYEAALEEALRVAGVDALPRRAGSGAARPASAKQLGIGVSTYVEITGFGGTELGSVAVDAGRRRHGHVRHLGARPGPRHVVRDDRGRPAGHPDRVDPLRPVRHRRGAAPAVAPAARGRCSSAAARSPRPPPRSASRRVELAASLLEAAPEDIEVDRRRVRGSPACRARALGWAGARRRAPRERDGPCAAELDVPQDGATFPFGAHVSVVEVDTETGAVRPLRHVAVDDCGRIVNPLSSRASSTAASPRASRRRCGSSSSTTRTGSRSPRRWPSTPCRRAADTLASRPRTPRRRPTSTRSGPRASASPARSARCPPSRAPWSTRCSHLGVRHMDIPCTPERVWRAVRAARQGRLADPWREPPAAFDALSVQRGPADGGVEV